MNLLLDTVTFLWWLAGDRRVTAPIRARISDPGARVYLSAVSTWEIAIKHGNGRLPLPAPPERYIPEQRARHGFELLPIGEEETLQVAKLPLIHADPFDRLLVAQAIQHGLTLVTPDLNILLYPCRTLWS